MDRMMVIVLILTLVALPSSFDQVEPDSILDDIGRWFEQALADVVEFFDNLGENLARAVENLAGSLRTVGESLSDQITRAVNNLGDD